MTTQAPTTPPDPANVGAPTPVGAAVARARGAFATGRTRELSWRREQLDRLIALLTENARELQDAMAADLGRPRVESHLSDVFAVIGEAKLVRKNLHRWTRNRMVPPPLALGPARAHVRLEPLGTVLIIGPWNYPVHLLLMPLIGAIGAGNSVVLKPSELAPECSRLMARLLPAYLDDEAIVVVEGAVPETTELLEHAFDHIFYTGNGAVGKIVMAAAAKHLTPVTLELGGKSPVFVDDTADVAGAAATIAWGKYANCGQTCVAPDFVLATPGVAAELAQEVSAAITRMYGTDPQSSPDYGRIVNERHAQRLSGVLGSGRVVAGGEVDVEQRYVAPTVLADCTLEEPVMQDEIFGPVLPIVTVSGHDEAIEIIGSRPKPLALYVFSTSSRVRRDFTERTSSGSLVFGTVMAQVGLSTLPFGGVGASGMGSYHGRYSIETFSHHRSVLVKGRGPDLARLSWPPYTERKKRMLMGR